MPGAEGARGGERLGSEGVVPVDQLGNEQWSTMSIEAQKQSVAKPLNNIGTSKA